MRYHALCTKTLELKIKNIIGLYRCGRRVNMAAFFQHLHEFWKKFDECMFECDFVIIYFIFTINYICDIGK